MNSQEQEIIKTERYKTAKLYGGAVEKIAVLETQLAALEADNQRLTGLLSRINDNFKPCSFCDNGEDQLGDACRMCGGTGDEMDSKGIMLSELLPEIRAELDKAQS